MLQSTVISSSRHTCCNYTLPDNLFSHKNDLHLQNPAEIAVNWKRRTDHSIIELTSTHSCSKEQEIKHKHNHHQNRELLQEFSSSIGDQKPYLVDCEAEAENPLDFLSNMGWADLKAALGQRINFEGIACSFGILSKDKQLAIPHVTVRDSRSIDWEELKNRGFQGVVFDKDNTIAVPYSLSLWNPLGPAMEQCKSLFGSNIAVFSNSAGLYEYDPDGRKLELLRM